MNVNYDFTPGDVNMDLFKTDVGSFGGVGSFTDFDMPVNSFPDFYEGSINYSSFY